MQVVALDSGKVGNLWEGHVAEKTASIMIQEGQEWGGPVVLIMLFQDTFQWVTDSPLGPTSQRSQHLWTGPLWGQSHPRAEALTHGPLEDSLQSSGLLVECPKVDYSYQKSSRSLGKCLVNWGTQMFGLNGYWVSLSGMQTAIAELLMLYHATQSNKSLYHK